MQLVDDNAERNATGPLMRHGDTLPAFGDRVIIQFPSTTLTVSPDQNGESSRCTGMASRRSSNTTPSINF